MANCPKSELIRITAEKAGIVNQAGATTVLDALLEAITERTEAGDKVILKGFGSFEMKTRAARQGRNPATGETIQIPETRALTFKASKSK